MIVNIASPVVGADLRSVALTFDDGPSPDTDRILEILDRYEVTATFFCIGAHVAENPKLALRVAERGHSIGNHTWSHRVLHELTADEFCYEIDATGQALSGATGRSPSLLRPPYGSRTPAMLRNLADHGLTSVLWDVDPRDWDDPGADAIVDATLRNTRNGSIVLLHDGSPEGRSRSQTAEALPSILEGLLDRGYRFVTADDDSVADARAGAHIPHAVAPAFPHPGASPAQSENRS
jgi:peptidoglycan-N-acetylglucosamine deacetylase